MNARRLRSALSREGGTLAATLRAEEELADDADLMPTGSRIIGREAEYELLLDMIGEATRLHYGEPRVVAANDADLALLLGDQLYALGLARLAALGDVEAVGELGDAISLIAQAEAAGDAALSAAVWDAAIAAVTGAAADSLAAAKALAREGDRGAVEALRAATGGQQEGGSRDARLDVDDTLHTPFN